MNADDAIAFLQSLEEVEICWSDGVYQVAWSLADDARSNAGADFGRGPTLLKAIQDLEEVLSER